MNKKNKAKYNEFRGHKCFIYAFRHPITNECKYIGQTRTGLKRLYTHFLPHVLNKYNQRIYNWIGSLKKQNLEPKLELIEIVNNPKDLDCAEIFWISYFRLQGNDLCNLTNGGTDAVCGTEFYKDPGFRQKQRDTHKHQSKQTIELHTQRVFPSTAAAARFFGVERTEVSRCVRGKTPHINGYIFQYFNSDLLPEINDNQDDIERKRLETKEHFKKVSKSRYQNTQRKIARRIEEVITGKVFYSLKEAGEFFGLDHSTVRRIAEGLTRSKAGLEFKFV